MSPKEEVLQILDQLPDDASLEDIQYQIHLRNASQRSPGKRKRRTAQEIYKDLDLGPGGYAIAPSTETRRGVREAIRRKLGR
jgi:hypothetical protein